MDKKKIALIVVVLFLLIGLGSFVFANPDQDNNLEGPGVSEDGGSGDGEVIDGTEPTATPEEENDDSATETDPITTYGNGGNGTGTGAGNNGTTGGVGNTDMSQYDDARRIIEELENRVNSMKNKDDSNNAVDYRTDTDIIDMVNNLPDGTVKDELKDRLDAINKVLDDTKAPVITGINNGDVTKENVTINVTDDNDVTITATLDGEEIEFTTPLTEEGHYVVTVTDKNFNTTTVEFTIDKTAPQRQTLRLTNVSRKDADGNWLQIAKAGDVVRVIVQFDEELTTLPTLKINGTEVGQMKYDENMVSYTFDYTVTENDVNGIMQIEISNYADVAGNVGETLTNEDINHETQNQMIIDTIAPVYSAMGIFNWTNNKYGGEITWATKDEHIRLYVSFPEMLATNPKVDIYGKDGKVTTLELTYSEAAKFYFVEFDTTEELNLPEGKISYKVYGYADEAGNVGADLTQDMTTSKEYPEVIYDSVAPVLNFNNGFITDSYTVQVTDDNFDYMTVQYYDGRGLVTLAEPTFELDANGDNIRYNIKAYDKAGNVSAYADIYLDNQKPVISGTGVNGKNEVAVSDNGYYKNATLHIEDGSMKKVVLVHEDGTEEVLAEYKDNYTTEKMVFDRTFDVDGKYTIKAIDRKGNESTITFTIDTVKPVITGIENGAYTNQDVTLNVTDVNPGGTIHLKRNGELVKNYSFGTPIKEEGSYEVYVSDLAGNVSATVTFTIDKTVPTKTSLLFHSSNANNNQLAKPGDWFGVYLTVDEELGQNPVFVVNGVQYEANQFYTAEGVHQYSAVYEIPANTPAQEMTFTISNIVDKAGNTLVDLTNADANEGVNTIVYDNVSPGPRVVGITGFFAEAEDADAHYITTGEGVRILTYYNEKLGTAPIVKIGNKEFQTYYAEQSSDEENGSYAYYADIKITEDLGLSDGEIQFSISGHKDAAGNEGRAYTNADITYGESSPYEMRYDKVILDNVAPEFNVTSGTHGETSMNIVITDDNFDYAVIVNQDNGVKENVYEKEFTLQQEATYHIYAYDKAENVSDLWVAIDNENPFVIIKGTGVDGYYRSDVTIQAFDKFLTTVKINDVTYDRPDFTSDSRGENFNFETTVSEEGTYTVVATDKYGHLSDEYTFVIDKTAPVIEGAEDGGLYNTPVTLTVIEENLQNAKYQKDGGKWVSFESGTVLNEDGTYFVRVTDKAYNTKATLTFTIDQTAPKVSAANILVDGDINEQSEFYATKGDTIYSYVRFNEELKELPKFYLVNNGTEYEMSDVAVSGPNVNGEYTYSIRYTITDETTMADGQIEMKVTGISDKAGNTIDDITKPTNGHIVYLDRQAPEKTWLYVLNVTDENNRQLIGNGQTLRVELNTTEELAELPVLTIGNSQSVEFRYRGSFDYGYIYVADLKIDQTIANLIDNEVIPFTVTNIVDKAGNVIETVQLDNDDVTYTSNYGQVTFDGVAPEINVTALNDEGYSNDQTLHVSVVDRNQMTIVITNAAGEVVRTDGCVQGSDGYWSAYDLTNEISVDGTYTVIATDAVGNKSTTTFTVDRLAPEFDLSAIPTTFTIGKDIYQYPQPGKVTDNIDGNISFGQVHMNWYHKNSDDSKGEATTCFGGDNWNTSLTSCEPGDYIITYRVSDKAGNETTTEQTITLVKENSAPVLDGVVTGGVYTGSIPYNMYDEDGDAFTIYYDLSKGFTNADDLVKHAKENNQIVEVAAGVTYDGTYDIPVNSGEGKVSVCLEDTAGNRTFLYNITINQ